MNKKNMTLDEFLERGYVFGGGEEPEPTSPVNSDGSFAEDWSKKYGEDNQAHLSRYKDFDSFVDSHISQRKKFSKDPNTLVEIPNEHSSDEVRAAFHKARGKPDTTDGYVYEVAADMKAKLGVSDDRIAAFKQFAHEKLHLSPPEFNDALDFYFKGESDTFDAADLVMQDGRRQARDAGMTELKKHFGSDTIERSARANAVLIKYGESLELKNEKGEPVGNVLEKLFEEIPAAKNSPWLTLILDNFANSMSEDTLKGLGSPSGDIVSSLKTQVAEIRSQMDKIIKENPSNYKGNTEFRDLQKRKTELYKKFSA